MTEKNNHTNQLPKDWKWVILRDVCKELQSGKRPKGGVQGIISGVPSIGAEHLDYSGGFKFEKIKFVPEEFAKQMKKGVLKKDDIIIVKDGATTAKTSFVSNNFPFGFAVINEHVFILRVTDNVIPRFAFYRIWSSAGNKEILQDFRGAAQGGISSGFIDKVIIPLPPKPTQLAIVSKIEELFSELEKGIESLFTAKQQLKTYRQSVLKWAFEGKLTNEYIKDGELPKGWKRVKLGEVIEKPKYGTSKKCDYETKGLGVLRIPNIVKGVVDSSDLKFAQFDKQEIQTYNLEEEDILIIRSNGSVDIVGKCALITKKDEEFLYAGYLIRLRRLPELVLPKYLLNVLSSINLRNQIERKAKSTSGVNNINSEELSGLIIPLPSIKEQDLVVQAIESRLSVADKMEESITQSLQQAEALKQSILKKAFEGKLLLNINPDYENGSC